MRAAHPPWLPAPADIGGMAAASTARWDRMRPSLLAARPCPERHPRPAGNLERRVCTRRALRCRLARTCRDGSCHPFLERGLGGLPRCPSGAAILFRTGLSGPGLLGAAIRCAGRPLVRRLPFSSFLWRRLGQDCAVVPGTTLLRRRVQRRLASTAAVLGEAADSTAEVLGGSGHGGRIWRRRPPLTARVRARRGTLGLCAQISPQPYGLPQRPTVPFSPPWRNSWTSIARACMCGIDSP